MIPVSDAVRRRRFPVVNVAIITACVLAFIYELTLSEARINDLFRDYGVVPNDLTTWLEDPSGIGEPLTVLTAAFLHGGWLHLIGNMLFLWVFGDNVEDVLGHLLYALFYAASAVGAVALQVAVDTNETIPMIGASGAIAGVLGAYLLLFPQARVGLFIPAFFFLGAVPVPAFTLIIFWFVMQLLAGVASLGESQATQSVAFWAHVGGFLTGFALMLAARPFVKVRAAPRRPRRAYWDD